MRTGRLTANGKTHIVEASRAGAEGRLTYCGYFLDARYVDDERTVVALDELCDRCHSLWAKQLQAAEEYRRACEG